MNNDMIMSTVCFE